MLFTNFPFRASFDPSVTQAYQCVCRMANATWQWILHRFQQFKGAGAGNGSSVQDAAAAALAVEAFGFDPEAETLEDALDQFLPVLNGLLFHGTVATAAKERVAFSDWAADHASALALPVFMRVITGEIPPDLLTYALTVLYNLFQGAPKQLREEVGRLLCFMFCLCLVVAYWLPGVFVVVAVLMPDPYRHRQRRCSRHWRHWLQRPMCRHRTPQLCEAWCIKRCLTSC